MFPIRFFHVRLAAGICLTGLYLLLIAPHAGPAPPQRPHSAPSIQDNKQNNNKQNNPPAKHSKSQPPTLIAPAQVVSRLSLGPAAGNGIGAFRAVVDPRRRRLYVLNQRSNNLSVVDLIHRRVITVVPLPFPWSRDRATDLNHVDVGGMLQMILDEHANRLYVIGPDFSRFDEMKHLVYQDEDSRIMVLSTDSLQLITQYQFMNVHFYGAALDDLHKRFYIVTEDARKGSSISVLDTESFHLVRSLPTSGRVRALTIAKHQGVLLTVETNALGSGWNEPRIIARQISSGKVQAQCSEARNDRSAGGYVEYALWPDDHSKTVLVALRSYDATTIYTLDPITLRTMNTWTGSTKDYATSDAILDQRRKRLLGYWGSGIVSRLDLHSHRKALRHEVLANIGSEESFSIGAVDPRTGQALLLNRNSVIALDGGTLHERWRLRLGADIRAIYLDRRRHRLLAHVAGDEDNLFWVEQTRLQPAPNGKEAVSPFPSGSAHLAAVDITSGWLYKAYDNSVGTYLRALPLNGQKSTSDCPDETAHIHFMVPHPPNGFYLVMFPENTDLTEPQAFVSLFSEGKWGPAAGIGFLPNSIFYVPAKDRLYLMRDNRWKALSGETLTLPAAPSPEPTALWDRSPDVAPPIDADNAGEFAYYADPARRLIYKLRLADSSVAAVRRLNFAPTGIAVDGDRRIIHLIDWRGGSLVRIRIF